MEKSNAVRARLVSLVQEAESLSAERDEQIGLTLLIGGIVVTGVLVAAIRFDKWVAENPESTDAPVLVLSSQKRLDHRGDPMGSPIEPVDTIYLRDAIILSTPIAGRFSYMLVPLDDVTGFSMGYRPHSFRSVQRPRAPMT
jgi:hypothetical protein